MEVILWAYLINFFSLLALRTAIQGLPFLCLSLPMPFPGEVAPLQVLQNSSSESYNCKQICHQQEKF